MGKIGRHRARARMGLCDISFFCVGGVIISCGMGACFPASRVFSLYPPLHWQSFCSQAAAHLIKNPLKLCPYVASTLNLFLSIPIFASNYIFAILVLRLFKFRRAERMKRLHSEVFLMMLHGFYRPPVKKCSKQGQPKYLHLASFD